MTKDNLLFAAEGETEYWVEFDQPELIVLAELIADTSTLKDSGEFYKLWAGACDVRDVYLHQFSAGEDAVRLFAQTHNLAITTVEA